jgi:SAM-dependent methyltransferase
MFCQPAIMSRETMPFYDNFLQRGQEVTFFGKKIIEAEIANRLKLVDRFANKNAQKVLEFGPGKGYFAEAAAGRQWEYVAVDGSPAIVKKLRNSGYNIFEAFVPPVPANLPGKFDVILMEHFIEHMPTPGSARELIVQSSEMLNRGGLVILVAPDYLSHRENFWNSDYTHSFVTTLERINQLLVDGGFRVAYAGYETLGIQSNLLVWLIGAITRTVYFFYIPQLISQVWTGSLARSNKWKNVLLRSCVIVGKKE